MGVVDARKPAASSELGFQMVRAVRKAREAMYGVCSFQNVDFCKLLDDHELSMGSPCWTLGI